MPEEPENYNAPVLLAIIILTIMVLFTHSCTVHVGYDERSKSQIQVRY